MRIVLLCQARDELHRGDPAVERLAQELRSSGHEVDVLALGTGRREARGLTALTAQVATFADRALARRGFVTPLAHVVLTAAMLPTGYDVAHAFSIPGAQAALLWRRFASGAVVFTSIEPVGRARLADRRLRLRLMRNACEDSDAVTAATSEAQAALWRWLAMHAPVIELGDVSGYERLYRSLTSPRG